ncbi:CDP-alcohol phosphatidyltransferase family protein [Streptomyces sp. NPDC048362]|uniref:CDP-alcohol phosphatidyltransferase family protein n=1 Tax=Streptomyces sp. NPDC048362 TaxID=3365539 RepID=UPI00371FE7B1
MTGFADAMKQLSRVQKPAKGSAYTLFVNRPAGRVLAAVATRAGATPNQLTALGAAFTFPALCAVALIRPSPVLAFYVSLALGLGFALDAADGQLARLQGTESLSGEWLDHVLDCARTVILHLAILVSFYRFFSLPSPLLLLAPMVFEFAAVVIFFASMLTEKLKMGMPQIPSAPERRWPIALLPVDYGVTCISFLFLGLPDIFIGLYCTLLVAHLLFLAALTVKCLRTMKRCTQLIEV